MRGDTIHIRPDDAMHERIAQMAKKDRRSLANMVLHLLDQHPLLQAEPKTNGHHAPKAARAAP